MAARAASAPWKVQAGSVHTARGTRSGSKRKRGYAVTAPGLTFVGKQIYVGFANYVPTVIVIAAIYITLNLILTAIATWVQKRFVGEHKIDMYEVGGGMATGGGF